MNDAKLSVSLVKLMASLRETFLDLFDRIFELWSGLPRPAQTTYHCELGEYAGEGLNVWDFYCWKLSSDKWRLRPPCDLNQVAYNDNFWPFARFPLRGDLPAYYLGGTMLCEIRRVLSVYDLANTSGSYLLSQHLNGPEDFAGSDLLDHRHFAVVADFVEALSFTDEDEMKNDSDYYLHSLPSRWRETTPGTRPAHSVAVPLPIDEHYCPGQQVGQFRVGPYGEIETSEL